MTDTASINDYTQLANYHLPKFEAGISKKLLKEGSQQPRCLWKMYYTDIILAI